MAMFPLIKAYGVILQWWLWTFWGSKRSLWAWDALRRRDFETPASVTVNWILILCLFTEGTKVFLETNNGCIYLYDQAAAGLIFMHVSQIWCKF